MLTQLIERNSFTRFAMQLPRARDWHPLVVLFVLYLLACAIAPEFGI